MIVRQGSDHRLLAIFIIYPHGNHSFPSLEFGYNRARFLETNENRITYVFPFQRICRLTFIHQLQTPLAMTRKNLATSQNRIALLIIAVTVLVAQGSYYSVSASSSPMSMTMSMSTTSTKSSMSGMSSVSGTSIVPSFQLESIIIGIVVALAALMLLQRRRQ